MPACFTVRNTNFELLHLTGETNEFGVIANPNSNFYPIALISDGYSINANQHYIRILNTTNTNPLLHKNAKVDFYFIAIRISAF